MKILLSLSALMVAGTLSLSLSAQTENMDTALQKANQKNLYIDVHQLTPGDVKFKDVAAAHAKDLSIEKKYGVQFISYWVNEEKGLVYCLSSSADTGSIRKTHAEAHGLLPAYTLQVTDGIPAEIQGHKHLFLDIHELGAGKVSARDVEAAHRKDLEIQKKFDVNFINYWVDEKAGVVMCLSEARDSSSVIQTHKMAHGLVPVEILKVKQGK